MTRNLHSGGSEAFTIADIRADVTSAQSNRHKHSLRDNKALNHVTTIFVNGEEVIEMLYITHFQIAFEQKKIRLKEKLSREVRVRKKFLQSVSIFTAPCHDIRFPFFLCLFKVI